MPETTETKVEEVEVKTRDISAQTIKLLFGASKSGKSMLMIEDSNMFIVNNTTYQEVVARKITSLTFTRGNKLEPQPGKPEMWSWRPTDIKATKMAEFEQEAVEIEAEGRLIKAKIELRKFKAEFKEEA
jgi:hypothetical protein